MLEINKIYNQDCLEGLKLLDDNSVDSIVTDPPYGLGFMGKAWDNFRDSKMNNAPVYEKGLLKTQGKSKAPWLTDKVREENINFQKFCEEWARECIRVLKPGGHLLAFGGTRTYHRMACAIEDVGFEIRDQIQWIYGCLSEDTEILTSEGWKNKDKIKELDEIFSMNLNTNKIIPNKVKHVFQYNHNGNMVNLINDNTDQLLTSNHKTICKEGRRTQENKIRKVIWDKNLKYKDAGFIDGEYFKLPLAGYFDGNYSIGKDFSELIGWILSEGYFHKDTNAISIYQSSVNADKVKRIKYILGRCKIKYSHYEREREYKERLYTEHQFYFSGEIVDKIKNIIPNKKPLNKLWYLPLKEKERLYNGLCLGDGSKGDSTEFQAFYQKDIKFLEWFQVLLHLMGKQGRINEEKYSCSIHHNDSTEIQGKHYTNRIVNYNGIVWCIETEIGNFIAKRNGKIFITGNSAFPKSMNISKAIDKKFGAEREVIGAYQHPDGKPRNIENHKANKDARIADQNWGMKQSGFQPITSPATDNAKQWDGWGTCLKPANEPIVVARKPLSERTIVDNVLKWGTGGLNIDDCRVDFSEKDDTRIGKGYTHNAKAGLQIGEHKDNANGERQLLHNPQGRFPANIILDEVAGKMLDEQSGERPSGKGNGNAKIGEESNGVIKPLRRGNLISRNDSGGASRFFYCAKASKKERGEGNTHPTVKPLSLIKYLITLVTPPNGICLDPFEGSGTHALACKELGFNYMGFELDNTYYNLANKRIEEHIKSKNMIK